MNKEERNKLGKWISERNDAIGDIITHYENGYTISDSKRKIKLIHINKNVKDNSDLSSKDKEIIGKC